MRGSSRSTRRSPRRASAACARNVIHASRGVQQREDDQIGRPAVASSLIVAPAATWAPLCLGLTRARRLSTARLRRLQREPGEMLLPRVPQAAGTLRLSATIHRGRFPPEAGIKSGSCGLAALVCGLPGVISGVGRVGSNSAAACGLLRCEVNGYDPPGQPVSPGRGETGWRSGHGTHSARLVCGRAALFRAGQAAVGRGRASLDGCALATRR